MLERFSHTNSKGETLDFVAMGVYINYNQLRDYEWEVTTENDRITGFKRGVKKKNIPFVFAVDEARANEIKDKFYEHFDVDVLTKRAGYFLINGYKYYCYVTKSVKSDYLIAERHLKINVETTSDKPYWYREKLTTIDFNSATENADTLKYPFTYPFTYGRANSSNIINDDFIESDAIVRMYGEVINPLIKIGDNVYQVNTTIASGEYAEINTIDKTIFKYSNYGESTNIFETRNKDYNIFKPIPSGANTVSANEKFKVDIVLIEKRSEPKWS